MAITRIGAVAVPINTFFVPAELAWVLRDADIQVLLTVESLLTNDYPVRLEQAIPDLASAHDPWLTSADAAVPAPHPRVRRIRSRHGRGRSPNRSATM